MSETKEEAVQAAVEEHTPISPPSASSIIPITCPVVGRNVKKAKFLIIGRPKSGKTTLAASVIGRNGQPNTVLFATETGHEHVTDVLPVDVTSWSRFLAGLEEVRNRPDIERIVIDTFSKLARMCQTHICRKLQIVHPSDMDHGIAWGRLGDEFLNGMTRLTSLHRQIVLIAHTKETSRKVRGQEVTTITVDLPSAASRFAQAEVDVSAYLTIENDPETLRRQRVLYLQGSDELEIDGRYVHGADVPDRIIIPDLPVRGWPVVEAVMTKAFQGPAVKPPRPARKTIQQVF